MVIDVEGFNRRVGNRTGRTWTNTPRRLPNPLANPGNRTRAVAYGEPGVRSATTRSFRELGGGGGGSGRRGGLTSYNPSAVQTIFDRTLDELTQQYNETAATQLAVNAANEENEPSPDRPWYEDIGQAIFGAGEEPQGTGGFSNSIVGRALNIINRPRAGIVQGLENLAGQQENTGWSPSDLGYSFGNFGSGFAEGFTGQSNPGFGEVYEAYKDNPVTAGGPALQAFEESHPYAEQWLARGVGFAGEIAGPTSIFRPSMTRIFRNTDEIATEAATSLSHVNIAREAGLDFAANNSLVANNAIYSRHPEYLADMGARATQDAIDAAIVTINGGGSRGVRLLNNRSFLTTVANQTVSSIREGLIKPVVDRVNTFWNSAINKANVPAITQAGVNAMRNNVHDFDEFYRILEAESIRLYNLNPIDAIKAGRLTRRRVDNLLDNYIRKYEPDLDILYDDIFSKARNASYRAPGFRVFGQQIPFKPVGRAFNWVGQRTADSRVGQRVFPSVQNAWANNVFESMFPGRLGLLTTRAKASSLVDILDPTNGAIRNFDEVLKKLEQEARKWTPEQSREFTHLLDSGVKTGNAEKDRVVDWLRQHYDGIFAREQAGGGRNVRGSGSVRAGNYSYLFLKGGSKDARAAFKKGRKRQVQRHGNTSGFEFADAKAAGLRPVENAFENLRMRHMKANRDMTRAFFFQDIVNNYSAYAPKPIRKLSEKAARQRGLVPIPYNRLNASFRTQVDRSGGLFYVPKPFMDIAAKFDEILGWDPANGGALKRNFAKVISLYKTWQTIPFTGFHTRNFIGDVFMGLMDGVGIRSFAEIMKKYALNKAGKTQYFDIIPGIRHSYDELFEIYSRHADSGFFATEYGTYHSLTAGQIPRKIGSRVANTARNISDTRELIPRFTHFVQAYRDEMQALWKQGKRDLDVLKRRGAEAALWRVNHYKFDYAALMPLEQRARSLAFPFYTYLRKAIPTMVEQMFVNPHWLATAGRFFEQNDGSAADEFNSSNIPQWIRNMGFAAITDEEEPLALTADVLPLGALDILSSFQGPGIDENIGNPDFIREILSNLNPALQIPIEMATGRTLYEDQPIPDSLTSYLGSKVPLVGEANELINQTSDKPLWLQALTERFMGGGIPLRRVSEQQQLQQLQTNRDTLIDEPLAEFNHSQDRYRITVSTSPTTGQLVYNINDQWVDEGETETVMTFTTPQAALTYARSLPGANYEQPFVSSLDPPTYEDVLTRVPELTNY